MTAFPDCKRKFFVRNNDLGVLFGFVELHHQYARGTERTGNIFAGIAAVRNYVDLFAVEFCHDRVDAHTFCSDTRSDGVEVGIFAVNRHLGTVTRFADNVFDFDQIAAQFGNFDFEPFLESVERNLCAKYNYASYLLDASGNLSEAIELLKVVATQDQHDSLFDYKVFLSKDNGADTPTRWRFLQGECDAGHPEAMFILGKHEYAVVHRPERAVEYFQKAAAIGHAEAQYAYGTLLLHEFEYPLSSVEEFYREACEGGVLFAQYEYGVLLSKMNDRHSRELGARYLQMAAKEVLLRRQCKAARIESPDGRRIGSSFFYNGIPDYLTDTATDNYIWEHLNDNLAKLDRYTWKEIMDGTRSIVIKGLSFRKISYGMSDIY